MAKCRDPKHGDYQCNLSMQLFKASKATGGAYSFNKPMDVGAAIVAAMPAAASALIGETTVAPSGFINLRLSKTFLTSAVCSVRYD